MGVRERVRRVRLNWTVHVPVSSSLQENGAEKSDGGRFVKGRLDEGDEKRCGRIMRECTDEDVPKGR